MTESIAEWDEAESLRAGADTNVWTKRLSGVRVDVDLLPAEDEL